MVFIVITFFNFPFLLFTLQYTHTNMYLPCISANIVYVHSWYWSALPLQAAVQWWCSGGVPKLTNIRCVLSSTLSAGLTFSKRTHLTVELWKEQRNRDFLPIIRIQWSCAKNFWDLYESKRPSGRHECKKKTWINVCLFVILSLEENHRYPFPVCHCRMRAPR